MDTPAVFEAEALVRRALDQRPSGLVFDIDGTLSPIAPTPDAARLAPGAREALWQLADQLDLVAVVSGRSAADAAAMVGVPDVLVVGNHGLESIERGERVMHPEAVAAVPRIAAALAEIEAQIVGDERFDGVIVENKELSGSVHFRLAPDRSHAGSVLLDWARELAGRYDLRVTEGRMVVELRPPVAVNKGAALRRIIQERSLRGVVFFGDDVTDVDGFRALAEIRRERGIAAYSIAVADPEARPDVIEAADASVDGVDACVALLARLAREESARP